MSIKCKYCCERPDLADNTFYFDTGSKQYKRETLDLVKHAANGRHTMDSGNLIISLTRMMEPNQNPCYIRSLLYNMISREIKIKGEKGIFFYVCCQRWPLLGIAMRIRMSRKAKKIERQWI